MLILYLNICVFTVFQLFAIDIAYTLSLQIYEKKLYQQFFPLTNDASTLLDV